MSTKQCSRCDELLPLEDFTSDKTTSDGKSPRCFVCRSLARFPNQSPEAIRLRRSRIIEQKELSARAQRRCSRCQQIKNKSEFYDSKNPKLRYYCKVCSQVTTEMWRQTASGRLTDRLSKRSRRADQAVKEWARDSKASHFRLRGLHLPIDNLVALIPDGVGVCLYCNAEVRVGYNASVDIVDPERASTSPLALACKSCNSTKCKKSGAEYVQILRDAPHLAEDLRQRNRDQLKAFYAKFIPYDILRKLAESHAPSLRPA